MVYFLFPPSLSLKSLHTNIYVWLFSHTICPAVFGEVILSHTMDAHKMKRTIHSVPCEVTPCWLLNLAFLQHLAYHISILGWAMSDAKAKFTLLGCCNVDGLSNHRGKHMRNKWPKPKLKIKHKSVFYVYFSLCTCYAITLL